LQAGNWKLETRNSLPVADHWLPTTVFLLVVLALTGCGYHSVGSRSVQIPTTVQTIAIPAFVNNTRVYHVEQVLTEAVVREFLARTQYRILPQDGSADAVLLGTVTGTILQPISWDSVTGRATTALVTVTARVALQDRSGKVLYQNPSYIFREQYQIATEASQFFQEQTPAVDRLARDFARTLVSNVLEGY
jgi:outer membrane lipopolysaccharide assembly protein LptE/RlpB